MRLKISQNSVRRLPKYIRVLNELEADDIVRTSSAQIAYMLGITASQVRQDLNSFGGFGQQGYGYHIPYLREELEKILGVHSELKAILVGCGSIGRALLCNFHFMEYGIELKAGFDISADLIGTEINGIPIIDVSNMRQYLKETEIDIVVLAVPKEAAIETAELLISCGVGAFWNFTNEDIATGYNNILVENLHFSDSLLALGYYLSEKKGSYKKKTEVYTCTK